MRLPRIAGRAGSPSAERPAGAAQPAGAPERHHRGERSRCSESTSGVGRAEAERGAAVEGQERRERSRPTTRTGVAGSRRVERRAAWCQVERRSRARRRARTAAGAASGGSVRVTGDVLGSLAQRRSSRCLHDRHSVARGNAISRILPIGLAAALADAVGAVLDAGQRVLGLARACRGRCWRGTSRGRARTSSSPRRPGRCRRRRRRRASGRASSCSARLSSERSRSRVGVELAADLVELLAGPRLLVGLDRERSWRPSRRRPWRRGLAAPSPAPRVLFAGGLLAGPSSAVRLLRRVPSWPAPSWPAPSSPAPPSSRRGLLRGAPSSPAAFFAGAFFAGAFLAGAFFAGPSSPVSWLRGLLGGGLLRRAPSWRPPSSQAPSSAAPSSRRRLLRGGLAGLLAVHASSPAPPSCRRSSARSRVPWTGAAFEPVASGLARTVASAARVRRSGCAHRRQSRPVAPASPAGPERRKPTPAVAPVDERSCAMRAHASGPPPRGRSRTATSDPDMRPPLAPAEPAPCWQTRRTARRRRDE